MWPQRRVLSCEKWKYMNSLVQVFLAIARLNYSHSHFTVRKLDANNLFTSIPWIHCDLTRLCSHFYSSDITNVFLTYQRTNELAPAIPLG
jgi:hypothetical protein